MNAPFSLPGLRPMAAGELIDSSVVFWRKNLAPLFKLYFALHLVTYALSKALLTALYREFPFLRTGANPNPEEILGNLPALFAGLLAVLALLFVAWWISWLGLVAGTHFTVRHLLGRPVTLKEAVGRMFQRAGAATGALLLSLLWGITVYLLALVPGLGVIFLAALLGSTGLKIPAVLLIVLGIFLAFLGAAAALLWFFLRFFLVPPVLSEETSGAIDALRRAGDLMSGRIGPGFFGLVKVRASVLLTGLGAMLIVISLLASTPAVTIQAIYGNIFKPGAATPDAVPQALLIPAELLQVVVQAIFAPLSMALAALFYVDLRVRREGLDLESRLRAMATP